jgi:hypothetical protein
VFVTLRYEDAVVNGSTFETSMGARMLDYAQDLLDLFSAAQTLYNTTPSNANYNALQIARRNYKNYVDNLEMVRGLTRMLEWADFSDR